jgi:hypothetical protein
LTYYSIGFSAMWAVPLLPGLYALFCRHVVPLFRRQLAKVRYQRIGGLTRLHLFRGATWVELLLLWAYMAGNGVAVALNSIQGTTIASSAALAASINLIPLLLGGRTSRVADVIGVSRPAYYVDLLQEQPVISCECSESDDDVSKMVWRRKAVWKSGAGTWCHCNTTTTGSAARPLSKL